MLGACQFDVRGQSISAGAQPYRFFLLQRVQAIYDALDASGQADVMSLLQDCGMAELIDSRLDRELAQTGNLEVWR
jgi:hypothetical protein